MSPRTPTLPPTEPAMWRKLLARTHPDSGGDHDLFIWTGALRDVVCDSNMFTVGVDGEKPEGPRTGAQNDGKPRIPYDAGAAGADFEEGTAEALRMAEET
jgi:hypothetical protein